MASVLCVACGGAPRASSADLASIRQPTPDPTLDAVVRDLPRVLAYVHKNFPASWAMWNDDDNGTKAPMFGFGPAQDLKDASLMVAGVDQGGMALPSIDYYLDESPQMKSLRGKYLQHVQKLLVLAGEPSDRATADAKTVMEIETAFAKASSNSETFGPVVSQPERNAATTAWMSSHSFSTL